MRLSAIIRTVEVNGVPIGYTDSGDPTGRSGSPVIVFGHSLLFGGWMFRAQINALRAQYRCVAIDWRGQGGTQPTPGGYDMDSLTADALGLIRELDLAPVHWVGIGMGGYVGQRLAARHGAVIRSLTLLDTGAGAEDPHRIRRYTRLAWAVRLFGVEAVRVRLARLLFGPTFLASRAAGEMIDEWAARLDRVDRIGTRKAIVGVLERISADDELPRIAAPTLVAVGADDAMTPVPAAARLAAAIPLARFEVIERAGHCCVLEQPDVVTALLTRFLTDVES